MSYRVKIESFEGPFQLLLSLVSEQKVDIGAVSVAEVADQYLAYLEAKRELDMDVASDFLMVASTLLAIKASALLPDDSGENYDEEFEDLAPDEARDILIARLIAYKQFKNASAALGGRFENESRMHARKSGIEPSFIGLLPDYLESITLHNLAVICAGLVMRRRSFLLDAEHVTAKPLPIEDRMNAIYARLKKKRKLTFRDLLEGSNEPIIVVVNFLAVLELYHRGMVDLEQPKYHGAIKLLCIDEEKWAPAPVIQDPDKTFVEYLESIHNENNSANNSANNSENDSANDSANKADE